MKKLGLGFAMSVLTTLNALADTHYVSLDSPNPSSPYTNWTTAAHIIQDAVDAANDADTVLVTNGVYAVGRTGVGVRVSVTKAIKLESVNGPSVTAVRGESSSERGWSTCVYLGTNAVLNGFTLTNGFTGGWGGGVYCEQSGLVTNCVLTGNSAGLASTGGGGVYGGILWNCLVTGNVCGSAGGPARGGGAFGSILYNCTLSDNVTDGGGAGAESSTLYNCIVSNNWSGYGGAGAERCDLYNCVVTSNSTSEWGVGGGLRDCNAFNCTVVANSAGQGGGAYAGVLYNCIVLENTASKDPNYFDDGSLGPMLLNYVCTTPLPTNGVGNIEAPPSFMDLAAGDFRLREGSPCIDAGTNLVGSVVPVIDFQTYETRLVPYAYEPTDILGNSRFIDGDVDGKVGWDVGAYEFNSFNPPRFSASPELAGDGWRLNLTGEPNKPTRVQRSGNLKDWEDIWSGSMGAEGFRQVLDRDTGPKVMSYRAVVP